MQVAEAVEEKIELLTLREREILRLVSEHLASKEIGVRLAISAHTVDFHLTNARRKLGVGSRRDAAFLLRVIEAGDGQQAIGKTVALKRNAPRDVIAAVSGQGRSAREQIIAVTEAFGQPDDTLLKPDTPPQESAAPTTTKAAIPDRETLVVTLALLIATASFAIGAVSGGPKFGVLALFVAICLLITPLAYVAKR